MLNNIGIMIIGWFYYGNLFIAGSIIVTMLLNRITDKWYLPPLIINFVSVILLLIGYKLNMKNMSYALYFNYMPTVAASFCYNFIIFIVKSLKIKTAKSHRLDVE